MKSDLSSYSHHSQLQIKVMNESFQNTSHKLKNFEKGLTDWMSVIIPVISDRKELLEMLIDVLNIVRNLFFNPTPFLSCVNTNTRRSKSERRSSLARIGAGTRGPTAVIGREERFSSVTSTAGQRERRNKQQNLEELLYLAQSTEAEIEDAAHELDKLIDRIGQDKERFEHVAIYLYINNIHVNSL
eukprot:GHVL01020738.1.p1 GENE.GHVL01020738.1~~GHVL01020738.1.p1  ORF type:complete len:186 (+),score=35.69 GHVL01020738.1:485-1042(+)